MMGKIGDEEVDPDEEVDADPSTIFDSLGPSQRYSGPDKEEK
jgi:hypothetical protein